MKLGFIGDNDLEGVERDSAFAAANGFAGLEYNYWGYFKDLDEATVKGMADIHQQHGLGVSMFGLWGWNHLDPDKAKRDEARAMLDRAIGFAQIVGADHLAMGTGQMPGESLGFQIRQFLEFYPPIADRLRDAGIVPVFYAVHGGTFLQSLAAYEAIWEHLPDLKIKYDPANWQAHGDDYLDVCKRYANKIGYVHIKEHLYHGGKLVSQPAAGMGDVEFPKVLAFLYEVGYDGWLSIEPHGPIWSKGAMREKMLLLTKRYLEPMVI